MSGDRSQTSVATVRVYAAILAQQLISALTYLAAAQAMVELAPETVLVVRVLASAGLFALILAVTPGRRLPPKSALWPLVGLGFLVGPVNQGLFLVGLHRSRPVHAALLYSLVPAGVYLLLIAQRRARASVRRLGGIFLAFAGVVVLLLERGLRDAMAPLVGDLLILGAVAAWVIFTTEGSRFASEHGPVRTTAWCMISAAIWLLPLAPFVVEPRDLAAVSAMTWASLGYLVVLTSVVSYLLWHYALTKLEPAKVAVFSNLQPVLTALAAWALLGEALRKETLLGGVLVLAGVRLTQSEAPAASGIESP